MSLLQSIIGTWAAIERVPLTDGQRRNLERALNRFDRGMLAQCRSVMVAVQALRGSMIRRDDGSYWLPDGELAAFHAVLDALPEQALEREERERAVIAAAKAWQDDDDPNETLTPAEQALCEALDALRGELPGTIYVNSHSDDVVCRECGQSHTPLNAAGRCLGCELKENSL